MQKGGICVKGNCHYKKGKYLDICWGNKKKDGRKSELGKKAHKFLLSFNSWQCIKCVLDYSNCVCIFYTVLYVYPI